LIDNLCALTTTVASARQPLPDSTHKTIGDAGIRPRELNELSLNNHQDAKTPAAINLD
jgi:hypothetical protein